MKSLFGKAPILLLALMIMIAGIVSSACESVRASARQRVETKQAVAKSSVPSPGYRQLENSPIQISVFAETRAVLREPMILAASPDYRLHATPVFTPPAVLNRKAPPIGPPMSTTAANTEHFNGFGTNRARERV